MDALSWQNSSWDVAAQIAATRRSLPAAVLSTAMGSPPVLLATAAEPILLVDPKVISDFVLKLCAWIITVGGAVDAALKIVIDLIDRVRAILGH